MCLDGKVISSIAHAVFADATGSIHMCEPVAFAYKDDCVCWGIRCVSRKISCEMCGQQVCAHAVLWPCRVCTMPYTAAGDMIFDRHAARAYAAAMLQAALDCVCISCNLMQSSQQHA